MPQPTLFDRTGGADDRDRRGRDPDERTERGPLRNLERERPLVVFDLETTGVDLANDRIVQLAMIRVEPEGGEEVFESLVNPERPIPPEATKVHGITDDDVRDQPTFAQIRGPVERMLAGADLAGFNSIAFDQPMLRAELDRVGSTLDLAAARHLDAMVIFKRMERRDLTAAYQFYCDKELRDAHSALADTRATLEVLDAQIARYPDLPRDVEGLHEFSAEYRRRFVDATRKFTWDAAGEAVFNFGKVRGRRLRDVAAEPEHLGFLDWMLAKDFSAEVKEIVRRALRGEFPSR
jgi:DNA polymerase-3 subunit epsilon